MGSICLGFSVFPPYPLPVTGLTANFAKSSPRLPGPEASGADRSRHPGRDSPLDAARGVSGPAESWMLLSCPPFGRADKRCPPAPPQGYGAEASAAVLPLGEGGMGGSGRAADSGDIRGRRLCQCGFGAVPLLPGTLMALWEENHPI